MNFPELPDSFWDNIEFLSVFWLIAWLIGGPLIIPRLVAGAIGFVGFFFFAFSVGKFIVPQLLTHCAGVIAGNFVSYDERGKKVAAHVDVPFTDSGPVTDYEDGSWEKEFFLPHFKRFHHHLQGARDKLIVKGKPGTPHIRDEDYVECRIGFLGQSPDFGRVLIATLYDTNDPFQEANLEFTPRFLIEIAQERYEKIQEELEVIAV